MSSKQNLTTVFNKESGEIHLGGIDALVRLTLDQVRTDERRGLKTGMFVSGYRGSPVGMLDAALIKQQKLLVEHNIKFVDGLNEDLAATAVWGTQMMHTVGKQKFDGVTGMWYGKAPGVDRSGDALKHANYTGIGKNGGVLAIVGDDPSCKSSSLASQSEPMLFHVGMPSLYPANVQEILDLGLHGYNMSRLAGLWVGMKIVTNVADGTGTANVDPARLNFVTPDLMFDGQKFTPNMNLGMNVRVEALEMEQSLYTRRLEVAKRYARENKLNNVVFENHDAWLGIITAGKTYNDLRQCFLELGLDDAAVRQRVQAGLRNIQVESPTKTEKQIIRDNCLTYFNLIFLIIAIFLILAGSFRDLTFLPVIIANTLIGIVQEIKAKKTLEKLSVLNAPKATAIRDGAEVTLAAEDLVLDDIVVFTAGKQICADAVVLEGEVQVNESLLTGESDEITKRPGDELMSGSFIVSGSCKSRLTQVGEDSYISRLTLEAKAMKEGEQSEMIRSLNKLVKVVGILIIPIGLLLFGQQFFVSHEAFRESITSMVAAVLGMIPEGLYLLASVALAVSVMRLASQKVLVHDMKCIETLARVNVLCVDKTGTITETNMKVHDLILVGSSSVPDTESGENAPAPQKEELSLAVGDFASAMSNDNITMAALKEYFKDNNGKTAVSMTSFSSEFKYSSVTFSDVSYVLGAPEFVLRDDFARYQSEIEAYTSKGFRLLVFGTSETVPDGKALSGRVTPLGYVLLSNPIRKEAPETFRYFEDQGVHVKVISGDTPVTVSEVARQAGIAHAEDYIDASTLKTPEELEEAILKYTVFGRVTPDQKRQFVQALKKNGKTVAMTGDGVNDVLALKDADCSVAMASGSDAAAQAAQLVLLDNDFSKMPSVVLEGRRVVNNLQRSGTLFLVKNIFSFLLSIFSLISMVTYPLEPSQISLISMFTIGIPGFLLSLMPNKNRIAGHFITNILTRALPAALTDFLMVATLVVFGQEFAVGSEDISTAATVLLAIVGFMILYRISKPLNWMRWTILIGSIIAFIFCSTYLNQLFAISDMSRKCIMLLVVFSVATEPVLRYLSILVDSISSFYRKQKIFFLRKREARKAK